MKKIEELQQLAQARGYTVGTFRTNGPNFYQSAVLYVAVGIPVSRRSHRVRKMWDVSYSVGRDENGNNKWARALDAARAYIEANPAPTPEALDAAEHARRVAQRAAKRAARREAKRAVLDQLVPTTLRAVADTLPPDVVRTFGVDAAEHTELLDADDILAVLGNIVLVKQITPKHGLGWYSVTAGPTEAPVIKLA